MAIAVETERNAVRHYQGMEGAEIAESIFGLQLEMSGQDLSGGIVLKANESQFGAAAFQPVMTAGIGERHHTEARPGRPAGAVLARPALLRRAQLGGAQDAAYGLAAEEEVLLDSKFFRQMRVVEAPVLATGQTQDQLLLRKRNRPRHGASTIAVLHQPIESG